MSLFKCCYPIVFIRYFRENVETPAVDLRDRENDLKTGNKIKIKFSIEKDLQILRLIERWRTFLKRNYDNGKKK